MRVNKLFIVCLFLFATSFAHAMPPTQSPHEKQIMDTGIITGALLSEPNKPISNQDVILEVYERGNLILSLPKKTDTKGVYQFKNIFQTPDFTYSISANIDGNLYRTSTVSLSKDEKTKKMDLVINQQTIVNTAATTGKTEEEHSKNCPTCASHSPKIDEYKIVAIILSLLAIGYAIYLKKKKKNGCCS